MGWKDFIIIFLLSALLAPSHAQKIPFSNLTIQNGLPQTTVNSIVQDEDGYIWFATQMGAARYDGYEFEYLNTSNGLVNNYVNCMMVSRSGQLWFGTEGGISILEEGGLPDKHRG